MSDYESMPIIRKADKYDRFVHDSKDVIQEARALGYLEYLEGDLGDLVNAAFQKAQQDLGSQTNQNFFEKLTIVHELSEDDEVSSRISMWGIHVSEGPEGQAQFNYMDED